MDPKDNTPSETQSNSSVQSHVRGKTDKAWDYATIKRDETGKEITVCIFCLKEFLGGGIHRIKQHLAHKKGDCAKCKKVPPEVKFMMEGTFKEAKENAKIRESNKVTILDDNDHGKRKAQSSSQPFFSKGINDPSQPSIKKSMQSKENIHDVDLAIAMWFYDACIPINACNSPYFEHAINKVASIGYGYKPPTYHALRSKLLVDAKKEVSLLIDSYRNTWVECGCTIMSDGWRDVRQRHLINFLVYCPKGILSSNLLMRPVLLAMLQICVIYLLRLWSWLGKRMLFN